MFGLMVSLKGIGSVKAEMTYILAVQPVRVAVMAGLSSLMCVVAVILSRSYLKTTDAFGVYLYMFQCYSVSLYPRIFG